jgi:hypothetical protein
MIDPSRLNNALAALNSILVAARTMAYDERPYGELSDVLDVAEYLPRLLADSEERSAEFREQLAGLASKYPSCAVAVENFDKTDIGRW